MHAQSLSGVLLFATPWTGAHLAPLSLGFSKQEYCSGLPLPPPGDLPNPHLLHLQADSFTTEPNGKLHILMYINYSQRKI